MVCTLRLLVEANTAKKERKNTSTNASEIRGIRLALLAYVILVVLQLTAYLFTNVLVLYAQALEMISDVIVSVFLLLSLYWSRKPADEFHMFGHGRAQNVAAMVSATILIFFMSLEAFREAIPKLLQPSEPSGFQNVNLALMVIVAGMIVIAIPSIYIVRTEAKGASLKAQMVALLKDEISYVAALIAVALVAQGYYMSDTLASLFVALVIALGGIYLLKDNVHYLVGRAPSQQFFEKLESAARSVEGVLGVHDLKAEYVGPNTIQASFHLEVEKGTSIEDADRVAHEVEEKASKEVNCQYCVIHVDPSRDKQEGG